MRTIALVAAAAMMIPLGSCAALQKLSATEVPVTAILVAANGVDAAETTAKNYIIYCTPNPAPKGCDDAVIKNKIVPAVKAARTARDNAKQFVKDHPGATLGPSTLVDAVTATVATLQTILDQNNIPTTSK